MKEDNPSSVSQQASRDKKAKLQMKNLLKKPWKNMAEA